MISCGLTVLYSAATGTNNKGQIVGWYQDSNGADHGLLYSGQ